MDGRGEEPMVIGRIVLFIAARNFGAYHCTLQGRSFINGLHDEQEMVMNQRENVEMPLAEHVVYTEDQAKTNRTPCLPKADIM